jgi:hypothetical protein
MCAGGDSDCPSMLAATNKYKEYKMDLSKKN